MQYRYIHSPIGRLLLAGEDERLDIIGLPDGKGQVSPGSDWELQPQAFTEARQQLDEYFAGKRREFELVLNPTGTEFQLAVLEALTRIPYGTTLSYGQLAAAVGRPKAVRAVGAANGRNPLPIVIPCHRVIGADGRLTGFGGGLAAKAFLLKLESSGFQLS